MKKLFFSCIVLLGLLGGSFISQTYAASGSIQVTVTEYIPGANCTCITTPKDEETGMCTGDTQRYTCEVQKGFGTVVSMLGNIIKYFTFIAGLAGVLFIVINGIMYSMGGIDQSMKDEAKKRIIGTLIGLVVLFLSGVILNIIAPWIYV